MRHYIQKITTYHHIWRTECPKCGFVMTYDYYDDGRPIKKERFCERCGHEYIDDIIVEKELPDAKD